MNNTNILIIGAAGNNGQATLKALSAKQSGVTVRAAVRTAEQAEKLSTQFAGIETVLIDLNKPETLPAAVAGIDKVFIIPGNVENRAEHAIAVIDAAQSAGSVKHIVLYSVFGAEYEAVLFAKQFRQAEKHLEASGINWTHLRTIWFQENFAGWAEGIKQGHFYFGIRDGVFPPLNVGDIGEIAANILTSSGHENTAYNITGPELLSGEDIAARFSEVTGSSVSHISPPVDVTLSSLLDSGWPEWQAHGVLELLEVFASNQAAIITEDGEQLLGRPLTTLKQYIESNKAVFS